MANSFFWGGGGGGGLVLCTKVLEETSKSLRTDYRIRRVGIEYGAAALMICEVKILTDRASVELGGGPAVGYGVPVRNHLTSTSSDSSFMIARSWLSDCQLNHGHSEAIPALTTQYLDGVRPARMVDVAAFQHPSQDARLVGMDQACTYIALGYYWERESQKMGVIYSQAVVMIVATENQGVHEGFFNRQTCSEISSCWKNMVVRCTTRNGKPTELLLYGANYFLSGPAAHVAAGVLVQRTWACQDRMFLALELAAYDIDDRDLPNRILKRYHEILHTHTLYSNRQLTYACPQFQILPNLSEAA
ncbi:hypothetical protein J3E71DRAFT_362407 [Bipolaris maydis]|nr:hypothetical protein J3E71DRAFT_362407 [Bipolaris maydis]